MVLDGAYDVKLKSKCGLFCLSLFVIYCRALKLVFHHIGTLYLLCIGLVSNVFLLNKGVN